MSFHSSTDSSDEPALCKYASAPAGGRDGGALDFFGEKVAPQQADSTLDITVQKGKKGKEAHDAWKQKGSSRRTWIGTPPGTARTGTPPTTPPTTVPPSEAGGAEDLDWEKDTPACGNCDVAFSVRIRRHHCRSCGRCVCGRCSPASLELKGARGKQRVCTQCVSVVQASGQFRDRLRRLETQLHTILDFKTAGPAADEPPRSLEEALAQCEEAVVPLKAAHIRATKSILDAGERLSKLAPACWFPPSFSQGHTLDEAVSFCLGALEDAESHHEATAKNVDDLTTELAKEKAELVRDRAELLREKTRRQELDKRLARVADNIQALDAQAQENVQRLAEKSRSRLGSSVLGASFASAGSSSRRSSSAGPATRSTGSSASQLSPTAVSPIERVSSRSRGEAGGEFPENTRRCEECSTNFGRGPMARWPHHCRSCSRCVCAACSPGAVVLEGWRGLQRVCTRCTAVVSDADVLRERLNVVGQQLRDLNGQLEALEEPATLKEAVGTCEEEASAVKERHDWARETLAGVGSKLQEMGGESSPHSPMSDSTSASGAKGPAAGGSLADAVRLCRAAIDDAELRMAGTEAARQDADEIAAIHAEQAQEAMQAAEAARVRAEIAEVDLEEAKQELEELRASLPVPRSRTSSRNLIPRWASGRSASEPQKAEAHSTETVSQGTADPAKDDLTTDESGNSLPSPPASLPPSMPPGSSHLVTNLSPRSEPRSEPRPSRRQTLLHRLAGLPPRQAGANRPAEGEEPRRRIMLSRSRTSA